MTDSPQMLDELRRMAGQNGDLDESMYRRLTLAAMADIYEMMHAMRAELAIHIHPVTDEKIKALEQRDWRVLITAIVMAVGDLGVHILTYIKSL